MDNFIAFLTIVAAVLSTAAAIGTWYVNFLYTHPQRHMINPGLSFHRLFIEVFAPRSCYICQRQANERLRKVGFVSCDKCWKGPQNYVLKCRFHELKTYLKILQYAKQHKIEQTY